MPSADRLQEFVVIVESRSILAASKRIGIPRATLSRHLRDLEEELDTQLIYRSTRRLALTVAGEQFYEHARRATLEIEATWAALQKGRGPLEGQIRIAIPAEFVFAPLIQSFYEAQPRLELEVLTWTPTLDLVDSQVDVAVVMGHPPAPDIELHTLWEMDLRLVGAKEYVERHRPIEEAEDLLELECILAVGHDGRAIRELPLLRGGSVPIVGRLALPDVMMRLKAVALGKGISFLPIVGGQNGWDENADDFRFVLPDEVGSSMTCAIAYPRTRHIHPIARAFIEHASAFYDETRVKPHPAPKPGSGTDSQNT
ncbi:MAG: LysR family transcriptional regulator [Myxococcota bacterium]